MPMTDADRIRLSVIDKLTPKIAELLYQCDKGSIHARLDDLRTNDAKAVYLGAALLVVEERAVRVMDVQVVEAHGHAIAEDEQQTVLRQAREDIKRYGRSAFGRPGVCHICREIVITNRAELLLSDSLKTTVHGLCCAKDAERYEIVDEMTYRVKGAN